MDTRLLSYFLAIAKEGNMTKASELLHVTQPTLSKQLNKLEETFGGPLFHRKNRQMTLTESGLRLRDRAQEIVDLTDKMVEEMDQNTEDIQGKVVLGCAESESFRLLVQTFKSIQKTDPLIQYDIQSGNAKDVLDRLDIGLIDFALVVGTPNLEKYNVLSLGTSDTWVLIFPKSDPLSKYNEITPEMIDQLPLLVSKQALATNELSGWMGKEINEKQISATFNLVNNAAIMAEEKFGYLISLDHLVNTGENSSLCSRPLSPKLTAPLYLVWRQNKQLSPAVNRFLDEMKKRIQTNTADN